MPLLSDPDARRGARLLAAAIGVYAAITLPIAAAGLFAHWNGAWFGTLVALATVTLSLGYFAVPSIRAFARALGPWGLGGFHVWRIAAGLAFLAYGSAGLLPQTFVRLAGWGDLLAGTLAALLFVAPRTRTTLAGFHLVGLADFVVAVGTGLTFTFLAHPLMDNVALLPIALIPLIGVPISGASHVAALHQLATPRATAPLAPAAAGR